MRSQALRRYFYPIFSRKKAAESRAEGPDGKMIEDLHESLYSFKHFAVRGPLLEILQPFLKKLGRNIFAEELQIIVTECLRSDVSKLGEIEEPQRHDVRMYAVVQTFGAYGCCHDDEASWSE